MLRHQFAVLLGTAEPPRLNGRDLPLLAAVARVLPRVRRQGLAGHAGHVAALASSACCRPATKGCSAEPAMASHVGDRRRPKKGEVTGRSDLLIAQGRISGASRGRPHPSSDVRAVA